MKRMLSLALVLGLVATLGFVAAQSTLAAGYGGGKAKPYEGTITGVGSAGFAMSSKDNKTYNVKCDGTTQFMSGKEKVGPSAIKTGVHVTVQGGLVGANMIQANVVTIVGEGGRK